jgi:hypothetical protein
LRLTFHSAARPLSTKTVVTLVGMLVVAAGVLILVLRLSLLEVRLLGAAVTPALVVAGRWPIYNSHGYVK